MAWANTFILILGSFIVTGCDFIAQVERKSEKIKRYENAALNLARENRKLKAQLNGHLYAIQDLKTKNKYLDLQIEKLKEEKEQLRRAPSSVSPALGGQIGGEDLVQYDVFKWSEQELLSIAEKEFVNKNYEKAAQFFHTFIKKFPHHKSLDDQVLFQAGVAAFESKNHLDWTFLHLGKLVKLHPSSNYYRGAKLWIGLGRLREGDKKGFLEVLEEFRLKYRNTVEWKILSAYYEDFRTKLRR